MTYICDECGEGVYGCHCVSYEGVHGLSYRGGGPLETIDEPHYGPRGHRGWWLDSLNISEGEAARLGALYPGTPAHQAWAKHAEVLRADLAVLGYVEAAP